MSASDGDILWIGVTVEDTQLVELIALITDRDLETVAIFEHNNDQTLDDELCKFINSFGLYDQIVIAGKNIRFVLDVIETHLPNTYSRIDPTLIIDVPSIGDLFIKWSPALHKHRPTKATSTLQESVQEQVDHLRYYKELLFRA